jgi:2-methylisocitrate lyase-like PEP mutase family enzyme
MADDRTSFGHMDPGQRFAELHSAGFFVMPNAWDIGSAVILEQMGFEAIATTSSGHAASLGRKDQEVGLDELLVHAEQLAAAVSIPLSVDSERCYSDSPDGVARTVQLIAQTGAAGLSIEDYDPVSDRIDPIELAVERVAAAAGAARSAGVVLTARAENHLYGRNDFDDTLQRLLAYRAAGAEVVYAPLLGDLAEIYRVVTESGAAVNVLLRPDGPSLAKLMSVGVRRVSTGGALASAAYGALRDRAGELRP